MRKLLSLICLATLLPLVITGADASIQEPKPLQRFQPVYPFELFQQRVAGRALVEFVVDLDGQPKEIRVVEATHKDFEMSALSCISKWRFAPAVKDGHPIKAKMRIPFDFTPPKGTPAKASK